MKTKNVEMLEAIFRVVFERPSSAEVKDIDQLNTPKWDSLMHVALVTAIESEYGISLDAVDQIRMTSYRSTCLLLEERGL